MKIFIFLITFLNFVDASGQDVTINSISERTDTIINPIDKKCQACLDTALTMTINMMNCFAKARDSWEKEMDKYYNLLFALLNKEQQENLILAQSAWKEYKEKEFQLDRYIYYDNEMGKEKRIDAAVRQSEIFKLRSIELKDYYEAVIDK